jgi:hypothetical protein
VFGIAAKVHDDLVQLRRIAQDAPHSRQLLLDLDRRGQGGAQQLQRFLDDAVHLHGLSLRIALAAKGQDLPHQVFGAQACDAHLLHVIRHRRSRRQFALR